MNRLFALCLMFMALVVAACQPGPIPVTVTPSTGTGSVASTPGANSKIVTTASGLQYEDIVVGTGAAPQNGQLVSVHYTGMLTNGTKFDSSVDRGQPLQFTLGRGDVIKGWDEGILTMRVGGKRRLTIPPALGYGAGGYPPVIPPNSTLLFDVELLAVGSAALPPTPTTPAIAAQPTLTADQLGTPFCTGDKPAARRTDYKAPDDMQIDPGKTYIATIDTVKGIIRTQFFQQLAPKHVNSFIFLACQEYFDGLTFHRYEPGFVIQGGDPNGNGSGGPGYSLPAEFNPTKHTTGILSMARRPNDNNSAGSQFFIMLGDAPSLDGQYSVFGKVVQGLDVVFQIRAGDKINKVTITVH